MVLIVCFFICRFAFCWLFDETGDTARYLALKIGTNSKVFDLIGLLCCR